MRILKRLLFAGLALCLAASGLSAAAAERNVHICIDPGHGGAQNGAVILRDGAQVREKDLNLIIATFLSQALTEEYDNVTVSMTRTGDSDVGLERRAQIALEQDADALISIHNNAKGAQFDYDHGCTVLVSNAEYRPGLVGKTQALGCNLLFELERLGLENQGLLVRTSEEGRTYPDGTPADYYRLIRLGISNNLLSVIVEHAFLDNPGDCQRFLSEEGQLRALARADARGIARYFRLPRKRSGKPLPSLRNREETIVWLRDRDPSHNDRFVKTFYPVRKKANKQTAGKVRKSPDTAVKKKRSDPAEAPEDPAVLIRRIVSAFERLKGH